MVGQEKDAPVETGPGCPPQRPDDLIVPSRKGKVRNIALMLRRLHEDLLRLGMRRRHQYDARRTFISLARGDGASKDILRWVTHGPTGDIVDDYTTLPWPALCAEAAKLRINLREGSVIQFRQAAQGSLQASQDTAWRPAGSPRGRWTSARPMSCASSRMGRSPSRRPWLR